MAFLFEFARVAGVDGAFQEPMGPTVGGVWAEIGAGGDCCWVGSGCGVGFFGRSLFCGSVGAVVAGSTGSGLVVTAILVGVAEMSVEGGEGFCRVVLAAPFTARDVEQSRGIDVVVSNAEYGGFTRCVFAGGGETDADV